STTIVVAERAYMVLVPQPAWSGAEHTADCCRTTLIHGLKSAPHRLDQGFIHTFVFRPCLFAVPHCQHN
ncbi:MAG: hypothetical protein QF541_05060, partial [Lentisphaeria bacterium]|nr:hypothetical protein [Lentisphaeria bacterium]